MSVFLIDPFIGISGKIIFMEIVYGARFISFAGKVTSLLDSFKTSSILISPILYTISTLGTVFFLLVAYCELLGRLVEVSYSCLSFGSCSKL